MVGHLSAATEHLAAHTAAMSQAVIDHLVANTDPEPVEED